MLIIIFIHFLILKYIYDNLYLFLKDTNKKFFINNIVSQML